MEIEGTTFGTITRGSTFGSMCLDRLNCSPFAVSCGGLSAQPGLAIAF
jgi:hypothetical protein